MNNYNKQSNKCILLVDDDEINLMVQKRMCQNWGYDVITAMDGAIALQLIENHSFDLIISDINLPFVNGYKVSEYAMRLLPDVAFLFITGMNFQDVKPMIKGREMLQKPIPPLTLKMKIEKMMHPTFQLTA